jgi:hypothetical protein
MKNIEQLNDLFNLDPMAEKPMELTTIPEAMNSNNLVCGECMC